MACPTASDMVVLECSILLILAVAYSAPRAPTCTLVSPPQRSQVDTAGKIVPCREEDKRCFAHNKISFEGKCYTVGSPGPCRNNELFVIDKQPFEEGVVRGACRPLFSCDSNVFQERMAHDQCCYEVDDIKKKVCPEEKNLRLRKNVFGEGECGPISVPSSENIIPKSDLPKGYCYFPNVSFEYVYDLLIYEDRFKHLQVEHALNNMTIECSEEERRCFQEDKVPFGEKNMCYPLLDRGPCMPGNWLVLDQGALETGNRLIPVCISHRCLPGHIFMARDQRCRSLEELQRELCAAEDLVFDVFGEAHCGRFTEQKKLLAMPKHVQGGACAMVPTKSVTEGPYLEVVGLPVCAPDDRNRCRPPLDFRPERPVSD